MEALADAPLASSQGKTLARRCGSPMVEPSLVSYPARRRRRRAGVVTMVAATSAGARRGLVAEVASQSLAQEVECRGNSRLGSHAYSRRWGQSARSYAMFALHQKPGPSAAAGGVVSVVAHWRS